jgi:outer membrane protein OmpA-like peptidoglycan-associated protein
MISKEYPMMTRRSISLLLILTLVVSSVSLVGCATRKGTGAGIGAGAGAVIGGLIGKKTGNTAVGALIGAAVGGAAGAYIGNYMDEQAAEIERDLEGATVERVGEGIKITFDSGIMFDVNKAGLRPEAQSNLQSLATILQKYSDTDILIEGHTDSQGTEEHNLGLSRNRAQSVANQLQGLQVMPTRFSIMGYGESQPVADNASAGGRQQNRRVELAIMANDKLKGAADKKAG